ncbi:hypothetical protein NFI96_004177, partial [Prochilodus magdalenae]
VPSTASLIDEKDNEQEEDMEETTSTGAMASTSTYIESALHLSTGVTSTAQATLIDEEDNMGEEDMGGTTSSGTMASTSTQIASPPHLSTGDTSTAQDVEDTSGKGLTEVLLDHLQKHNLSISDCRGQSYDNGSNMMGQKQGVQARILQLNNKALCIPCSSHTLNLVVADAAKSSVLSTSFFGVLQRLYNLFSSSVQRWAVLRKHVKQLTLKPLSATRWEARIDSVKVVRYQLPEILEALSALQTFGMEKGDSETMSSAKSLHDELKTWSFLLCTIIWYNVLYQVNHVSKLLQSPNVSMGTLRAETEGVREYLEDFRENGLASCQTDAKDIAENLDMEMNLPEKRQRKKKRQFQYEGTEETQSTPDETFRRDFFLPLVDTALRSLGDRFSRLKGVYDLYDFLFSKDNMKQTIKNGKLHERCKKLEQTLHDIDADDLALEINSSLHTFPDHVATCPFDMLNYIYSEKLLDLYSNLSIALRLLLTLPVSVASGMTSEGGKQKKDSRVNIPNLISKLNLDHLYPSKLTTTDAFSISGTSFQKEEAQSEKELREQDLAFKYLNKLLTLDYRARSNTNHAECVISKTKKSYGEDEDVYDILDDESDECDDTKDGSTQIHPMDIQMAVYHCADSFLRQNMVTKLSSCQYALPLLVPSPTSTDIELPLWTFRQIKKTWKSVGDSSTSLSLCQVKAPMVFFCRLGSVSTSKSQLLSSLINPKHDTFFHRNSPGSSRTHLFMEGLVEIAWYCPAGNTDDLFSECIAFCNLHGDAADHRKQTDFLTERAAVNIILMENTKKHNYQHREILQKLRNSSKALICLMSEQKDTKTWGNDIKYKIGLRDRNQAELQEELRAVIRTCLQKCHSAPTFCLEESSELVKRCGFRVDEDSEDCQEGKTGAVEVMELLKREDISQIKTKFLPCQGKLWREWSSKNKQLYHLYGDVEQTKSKIQQDMKLIRNQQRETSLDFIKAVCRYLNSKHNTKKAYFVRWLGVCLDVLFLDELSEVTQQYCKQLSDVHALKYRRKITADLRKKQEELQTLSEKVDAVTCGLEHIMREMGQVYEAWAERPGEMPTEVSDLPAVAADLLISGHPLELMDGDAAQVPLTWIESILDKVTETLGDQRVFVLSVLGLQSSGKSTMLNTMFGLQFAVSAGRCTRGAFMQLIRVKKEDKEELKFDYLLVVDTEGLQSLQLVNKQSGLTHDNELATFVTGLADLTLINIFGENSAEMQDIIQIAVQAFLRMKIVNLTPSCMFVHQNVTDISAGEKTMEGRRRLKDKLDEMTRLAASEEVCSAEYFTDVIKFNIQTDVHYFAQLWEGNPPMAPPNPRYSDNVENLKQAVLTAAAGKNCLTLSELKVRIRDLWTAVLSEDFVFSFKNTLEISAYRRLEVMYGNWTWELRENMLFIESKLQNLVENGKLEAVDQKLISEEINPTFIAVQSKMEKFFNEDKDAEILSQWNARTEQRIKDVCDSLNEATARKMTELIKLKAACKKLDEKKTQYENELFNRSKDLSSRPKDKEMNEQSLRREFDPMWEKWLSDLRSEVPPIKDVNVKQEVMNILSSTFERRTFYSNRDSKQYKLIKNRREYSEYVTMKKQWVIISQTLDTKDHDSIRELVQETVREAEEIIRTKPVDRTGYSEAYTQEIVDRVKKRVEEFKPEGFRLRNEFTVDLSLYVCGIAVRRFTELHRVFREANDPVIYLENKKGEFFSIFKKQCTGSTAAAVLADFICNKLKPSILQSVYDQTAIDAAGEMRANYPAFKGNRSNLEKHILQDLAEDENFQRFITYIMNPKEHFSDFIHTKFKQEMLEDGNPRILEILKNAVKIKQSSVFTAIQKATQEIKQNRGGVDEWLEKFSLELQSEMKFTVIDLEGAQYQEITDTDFFSEEMNKTLQSVFDDLTSSFDHISSVRIDMFRQRPEDILMKQLCGCWVQCPFCKAICTNTIEGHDGKHSVPFHRPEGVNGWRWYKTDNLSVEICTSSVASDAEIVLSDEKFVPYRRYWEAGPKYACWSITPDTSEQAYWKWFVCRFQKDLEKYYNKTFQGRGEIPTAWKNIILPVLRFLDHTMKVSDEDSTYIVKFKTAFMKDLSERKAALNYDWLKMATVLDPRFKDLKCLPREEREAVWKELEELLQDGSIKASSEPTDEPPKKKGPLCFSSDSDSDSDDVGSNALSLYKAEQKITVMSKTKVSSLV